MLNKTVFLLSYLFHDIQRSKDTSREFLRIDFEVEVFLSGLSSTEFMIITVGTSN